MPSSSSPRSIRIPRYRVETAAQYLAINGAGIAGVRVAKKAWLCLGQWSVPFSIAPIIYSLDIEAVSSDGEVFILPVLLIAGPKKEDPEMFKKYADFFTLFGKKSDHVKGTVEGVIRE